MTDQHGRDRASLLGWLLTLLAITVAVVIGNGVAVVVVGNVAVTHTDGDGTADPVAPARRARAPPARRRRGQVARSRGASPENMPTSEERSIHPARRPRRETADHPARHPEGTQIRDITPNTH